MYRSTLSVTNAPWYSAMAEWNTKLSEIMQSTNMKQPSNFIVWFTNSWVVQPPRDDAHFTMKLRWKVFPKSMHASLHFNGQSICRIYWKWDEPLIKTAVHWCVKWRIDMPSASLPSIDKCSHANRDFVNNVLSAEFHEFLISVKAKIQTWFIDSTILKLYAHGKKLLHCAIF